MERTLGLRLRPLPHAWQAQAFLIFASMAEDMIPFNHDRRQAGLPLFIDLTEGARVPWPLVFLDVMRRMPRLEQHKDLWLLTLCER